MQHHQKKRICPATGLFRYRSNDLLGKTGMAKLLSVNGLIIEQFTPMGDTLENYFTKLIGGEVHE